MIGEWNKFVINEYLEDKVEMHEDMFGILSDDEKEEIRSNFIKSLEKVASDAGVDINDIISKIHLVAEIDSYLDYDHDHCVFLAKHFAN